MNDSIGTRKGKTPATMAATVAEAIARIDANDAQLRAWVYVDRGAARAAAVAGPLAGMPFGVKDVMDVAGMPTRYGLTWGIEAAPMDAWCVAALRAAGAVPIGKTHTTALAYRDPAPTRNPHHPDHTPGGSSAGSAAAVAAGHVPFALGTQTVGSTLRPACFCGVVGYKPTYGTIPAQGITPLAPSFDTLGIIAANAIIATRVASVFIPGLNTAIDATPRIGYAPEVFAERFAPEVLAALEATANAIAQVGARVERVEFPPVFEETVAAHGTIVAFEANAVLRPLQVHGFPPFLEALLTEGAGISYDAYRAALARRAATRPQIASLLAGYDAVLLGCADPAPGLDSTGDTTPLAPWTHWGAPSLALPVAWTDQGLPLGVQLVGAPGSDDKLLRTARWIESKRLTRF